MRLIIIFFLITFPAIAQDFNAGIRFGMCASQVSGDRLAGFDKAGLVGGVFVNRSITPKTTMQMEIVFIQKGSRQPTDDFNQFYRMRLHYLQVPVSGIWKLSQKINFLAGLSFGTLVFSEEDTHFGILFGPPFKKFELAAHGGLTYSLSDDWNVDVRYGRSVTTIRPFAGSYNPNFFDRGQYNELIELTLGWEM